MPAGQSRRGSALEVAINIVIGYLWALLAQLIIFPLVGIFITFNTNLIIGAAFTVFSVIRSYAVRRFFNVLHRWGYFVER